MQSGSILSNSALQGEELEEVDRCLFCGQDEIVPELEGVRDHFFKCDGGEFSLHRCENCRSLVLSPRPFGQRLKDAYSSYYTHSTPADVKPSTFKGRLKDAYIRDRFGSAASLIQKAGSALYALLAPDTDQTDAYLRFTPAAPARILDFGCGNGEYLLRMKGFGHDVTGVDFDDQALDQLRPSGIAAYSADDIDEVDWEQSFDHVTLSHVIEHVPAPSDLLKRLYSWTRPGGTLFLEVPNALATGLSVFGTYWRGLEAPRHFSLPSPDGLTRSLEEAGYSIEKRIVRQGVREWVWNDSLAALPKAKQEAAREKIQSAPAQDHFNAEFLTFLCRR